MVEKIGPYGSHYGQGCYTANCSLRDASSAGITRPITFAEADSRLKSAQNSYMTASGRTGVAKANKEVEAARAARNGTPEGLKELKQTVKANRKKFGPSSMITLNSEDELQQGQNLHDRTDAEFKEQVFKASSKVSSRDLRGLVEHSSRYEYDSASNSIVDKEQGGTLVRLLSSGELLVKSNEFAGGLSGRPGKEDYDEVKNFVANKVSSDTSLTISARPTTTSKVNESLKKNYNVQNTHNLDGSYASVVRTKKNDQPVAVIRYDKYGKFQSAEWASPRNDGSLIWPETSPIKVLKMAKDKDFDSLPVLQNR